MSFRSVIPQKIKTRSNPANNNSKNHWQDLAHPETVYMNRELPDVQAGFRKGRGTRDQIANIHWIIEKVREFPKNIYFCCIDYAKAFDCVDHNKLWKILKEMGIPDHLNLPLEKSVCRSESKLELDMKQQTGSI